VNWDADWFLRIAGRGYQESYECAFFPAFPAIAAALHHIGVDLVAASLLLNNGALIASCFLLYRIARAETNEDVARYSVLVILFHPLSFYFSIPYSESLFLLATLLAVYGAQVSAPWISALGGAFAVLTRNTGILMLPSLIQVLRGRGVRPWLKYLPLFLVPAALAAYMTFTAQRFGDPLLFVHAQDKWQEHIHLDWPGHALIKAVSRYRAYLDHHLPLVLLAIWLACRVWRNLPRSDFTLILPPLVLSLSLSKLAISPRLHLVLFPLWIEAGRWFWNRPPVLRALFAAASLVAGGRLAHSYALGLWVD
jgi:Gpi18-like mannosyltransferase